MKPRLNPTKINLKDLPLEGREFVFTNESGEMTSSLTDLIDKNPYEVRLMITPMGNAFDVRGTIKSAMDMQCSLCASDFKFKVDLSTHDLIIIQKALGKGDQQSRANHAHELAESGPDYMILDSEEFNLADYVHEAIALAEPIRPVGQPDCDPACGQPEKIAQREWLTYGEERPGQGIRSNPFEILGKMKLKG